METVEKKLSISALVGLITGVTALLLSAVPIINNFAFLLAAVALVLGIVGLVKTKTGGKKGRGMAIAAVILSILSIIIVLASQKFYSDTLDQAGNEFNESMETATGENTQELLGKEVDVVLGDFQVNQTEFMAETSLPVKVTNKKSEAKSYLIQIEAIDASGARIQDDTVSVNSLGANQTQDFKAFQFVQSDKVEALKTAKFKIVKVSQF